MKKIIFMFMFAVTMTCTMQAQHENRQAPPRVIVNHAPTPPPATFTIDWHGMLEDLEETAGGWWWCIKNAIANEGFFGRKSRN